MIDSLKFWGNFSKGWLKAKLSRETTAKREKTYCNIGILNPSIATTNLGDYIIYQSVIVVLRSIYADAMFSDFPTQLHVRHDALASMQEKDLLFVAGTNLLSSNLETRHQWKIHNGFKQFLNNRVVLFGCGWWQYQGAPNKYTKDIYKTLLNRDVLHSVRDQYTAEKLIKAGVENVLNTSCPTLWSLTPQKCRKIPQYKAEYVVTTLTFYHKNKELDYKMLELLSQNYTKVYLWPQGINDIYYFDEIDPQNNLEIEVIPPSLEAFEEILSTPSIDYIGTRLHAGARSLQRGVRTLIVAVDNRAIEIGNDVNLNVIDRNNLEEVKLFIEEKYITAIKLPQDNIDKWINSLGKRKP